MLVVATAMIAREEHGKRGAPFQAGDSATPTAVSSEQIVDISLSA